jgi:putative membrane protein
VQPRSANFRVPATLLALFTLWWIGLGIAPTYRKDWWLENVLVLILVAALVITRRRLRFSDFAYGCLFAFLVLHEVGAHYTYSEVPYERWWHALTGTWISADWGLARNHYDRFAHLMYGLLVFPAANELYRARATPRGLWAYLMPVTFVMSHSVLYEVIEWGAACSFGGDLGKAFLGTQGDPFDAEKDMALAMTGAIVAAAGTWLVALRDRAA